MRTSRFAALVIAVAMVMMGAVASNAAAVVRGIQIGGGPNITGTSLGQYATRTAGGQTLRCDVRLNGTYTIGLIGYTSPLTQVGSITGGTSTNCFLDVNPIAVTLQGFPWRIGVTDAATAANRLQVILGAQFRLPNGCVFTGDIGFQPNAAGNPVTLVVTLAGTFTGAPAACGNSTAAAGQGFGIAGSPSPLSLIFLA